MQLKQDIEKKQRLIEEHEFFFSGVNCPMSIGSKLNIKKKKKKS